MKKSYNCTKKTKLKIRNAFVEILGKKRRITEITVSELCKKADIAKSTFYNHYDDIWAVAQEFEDELINQLAANLNEVELHSIHEYELAFLRIIDFLKTREKDYRVVIASPEVHLFVEKLKNIVSKKFFDERKNFPFCGTDEQIYAQIRLLTNGCVDTIFDYFKGTLNVSLDEVGAIIISFCSKIS